MRKNPFKWIIIGGALAVIIMYGLEIATSGIERVHGPLDQDYGAPTVSASELERLEAQRQAEEGMTFQEKQIAKLERELAELKRQAALESSLTTGQSNEEDLIRREDRLPGIPVDDSQPAVNQLADSTSNLLQNMSSEGIRLIVSIFDGLTE